MCAPAEWLQSGLHPGSVALGRKESNLVFNRSDLEGYLPFVCSPKVPLVFARI